MPEVNKNIEIHRQTLFEYVVIKHPTIAQYEEGAGSEIIVGHTVIAANDLKQATLRANRAIPEEHMPHESRLEVVIRPF